MYTTLSMHARTFKPREKRKREKWTEKLNKPKKFFCFPLMISYKGKWSANWNEKDFEFAMH